MLYICKRLYFANISSEQVRSRNHSFCKLKKCFFNFFAKCGCHEFEVIYSTYCFVTAINVERKLKYHQLIYMFKNWFLFYCFVIPINVTDGRNIDVICRKYILINTVMYWAFLYKTLIWSVILVHQLWSTTWT